MVKSGGAFTAATSELDVVGLAPLMDGSLTVAGGDDAVPSGNTEVMLSILFLDAALKMAFFRWGWVFGVDGCFVVWLGKVNLVS